MQLQPISRSLSAPWPLRQANLDSYQRYDQRAVQVLHLLCIILPLVHYFVTRMRHITLNIPIIYRNTMIYHVYQSLNPTQLFSLIVVVRLGHVIYHPVVEMEMVILGFHQFSLILSQNSQMEILCGEKLFSLTYFYTR